MNFVGCNRQDDPGNDVYYHYFLNADKIVAIQEISEFTAERYIEENKDTKTVCFKSRIITKDKPADHNVFYSTWSPIAIIEYLKDEKEQWIME